MPSDPDVPFSRIAGFLKQHTHDVRNDLNGLDLEIALLQEIAADSEVQDGVQRLRKQVRSLADRLRALSSLLQEPRPILAPLAAKELLLIWREQHQSLQAPPQFEWSDSLGSESVNVDAESMAFVFKELTENAAKFFERGPVLVHAGILDGSSVFFELSEPKTSPLNTNNWEQPFFSTHRGSKGLGLWAVSRKLEANNASFTQQYSSTESALVTRIALSVVRS